jgi:gamma-glutamylputrescine oxidase
MADPLNNSYYRATANPFPAQTALTGDVDADVCVIGGGFTGLSAALSAAEAGYRTVLLEAEHVGFGASGRNGGQLIPGLRWAMSEIADAFGLERARLIHDVVMTAGDRVKARVAKHDIACDLKAGHFEAAYKPAHFETMRRELDFMARELGQTTCDLIAPNDIGRHVSAHGYHGGVYDHGGGHFHPLNYALGLGQAALGAGAQIFEGSRVVGIDGGARASVRTANGCVTAAHVIVGCDHWTGDVMPALGSYTVPIMNYNIATAPLGEMADRLLPSDAAVADSRFVLNYFRLSADQRMIFGGGEKYSVRPPADIAGFVRGHMAAVFPSLATVPIDYAWGGAVSVTMNRLPHFGRRGNIYFAHGFSGHGALTTTLAGELIVAAMRGTVEQFDLFGALPHRAFPGGRWLRRPIAALGLLWFALRDRL